MDEAGDDNVSTLQAVAQRHRAELWRHGNPDAWAYLVKLAVNEVRHKRRFSMQYLIEEVRRKSFVDERGMPSVIDNTIKPALTRLLIEDHPEVAPYMETRRAMCDEAFQGPS